GPRSTRSPISDVRRRSSSQCSSTVGTANYRCVRTTWARTSRPLHARKSACASRRPKVRTGWRSMRTDVKHLLSITDLGRDEIDEVLHTAASFEAIGEREIKKVPTLRGRTVVNLFYENSTRTRVSFELAAKRLSADVINVASQASSVTKGESLRDTAKTLRALGADA